MIDFGDIIVYCFVLWFFIGLVGGWNEIINVKYLVFGM